MHFSWKEPTDMADERAVVLAGTTYSMVEPPGTNTQVVIEEREKLLAKMDLDTLVNDLCNVGAFVRLAYYGLVAAGPQLSDMQLEVQELSYDVTRLCDKSAITVSKFKRASSTILTDLQATYEYLLDNLEDLALDTLASVSDLAGQMATAAKTLQEEFDEEAKKVSEVAKKTTGAKSKQQELANEAEVRQEAKERQKESHKELLDKAKQAEIEAERKLLLYESKENEAIGNLGEDGGYLTLLGNALSTLALGPRYLEEQRKTKERLLEEWKEKKKEALERQKECEKKREEAYQTMSDLTADIQNCKDVKDIAPKTVDALHQASKALHMLSAVMMQTARFWEQVKDHCTSLGTGEVKKRIEKALTYDDATRHRVWISNGFKLQALRFYAGWVALDDVCGDYMLSIRKAQKELYHYLTENPTYEEAGEKVKELASTFWEKLEEEQKSIMAKRKETEEKMKGITSMDVKTEQ